MGDRHRQPPPGVMPERDADRPRQIAVEISNLAEAMIDGLGLVDGDEWPRCHRTRQRIRDLLAEWDERPGAPGTEFVVYVRRYGALGILELISTSVNLDVTDLEEDLAKHARTLGPGDLAQLVIANGPGWWPQTPFDPDRVRGAIKHHLGLVGGMPPGSFLGHLIRAVEVADGGNRAQLAQAFPEVVEDWIFVQAESSVKCGRCRRRTLVGDGVETVEDGIVCEECARG